MSDVRINVGANVNPVQKGVEDIGKTVEKVNRVKWNPIDLKALDRDLKKAEQMMLDFKKRVGVNLTGGGITPQPTSPTAPSAVTASTIVPSAARPSGSRRRGRHRYTTEPEFAEVGRSFLGGMGGGAGSIASYAMRGAYAGANSGGALGGGMGLVRGLGIGALAFGALKAGQAVNEGYDMAKERAITLDTLKRQMGDLGHSFNVLKLASEGAAETFGVNSKESAKLMEEFTKLSRGVDKSEEGLMQSVATSGRIARAYGVDPSTSVGYFASVRHIDPRQNNRELALLLADAIARSGMTARADEVMQAIQSFAAVTARMSLSSPNLSAFAGAYSEMVGSKTPGLDNEASASILAQANASIMRMGGAGEAGQAFILAALNRAGRLNPIQAMALAQGGLFGTRGGVFDANGAIAKFMGASASRLSLGPNADVTNFESIRSHLSRLGGDKWFQLEGAQRLFGVNSLANAAALLNLSGTQAGGLQRSLRSAGVDINSLNESGIQTLAQIGAAKDKGRLSEIMMDMMRRTGAGELSTGERDMLTKAQGGSTEEFRSALLKVAALKDQAETEGSRMRAGLSKIEDAQIKVGDKLLLPLNTMRDALISITGKGEMSLAKEAMTLRMKEVNEAADADIENVRKGPQQTLRKRLQYLDMASAMWGEAGMASGSDRQDLTQTVGMVKSVEDKAIARIESVRRAKLKEIESQYQASLGIGASIDGATPLPSDAKDAKPGRDQIDVNVNVTNRSVGTDGRVTGESSSQTRVPLPRGAGKTGVTINAH